MKNLIAILILLFASVTLFITPAKASSKVSCSQDYLYSDTASIYQFVVNDIYGNPFDFSSLKGKKLMIVNTASKCGLTPQYEKLQTLYEAYKHMDLVIIGFPANNFMSQEPGTDKEIISFCQENYGVSFPMMSKISVKGKDMHPLYQFLTQKDLNQVMDSKVKWNFQKYLLDERGVLVDVLSPKTLPDDEKVIQWLNS